MSILTKKQKLIPIIASLIILVLLGIAFGIGFIKIIIPAKGNYRELIFNSFFDLEEGITLYTFYNDACSTILAFVGMGLALVSLIVNCFLFLINRNKLAVFLIFSIFTILGIACLTVHYSLLLSSLSYTFERSYSSGETIMFFGIFLTAFALLVAVVNTVLCVQKRDKMFIRSENSDDSKVLAKFASVGLAIVCFGLVFGSGAIPFSKTSSSTRTETMDWGDIVGGYQGNVGDKVTTKVSKVVSSIAYDHIPVIILMALFAGGTIAYFIIAGKKKENTTMYLIIGCGLGVVTNILQMIMSGFLALFFGVGTFMILGSFVAFFAVNLALDEPMIS